VLRSKAAQILQKLVTGPLACILAVGLAACFLPARRAAQVDPPITLCTNDAANSQPSSQQQARQIITFMAGQPGSS